MAEIALAAIAKSALQLFTSLAKDEFLLQRKSRKELQRLKDTIETLSCFLQDADRLQSKELSVQSCLSRIRNVMYEVDDFFDTLASQALHKKTKAGNVVQLLLPKSSFGFKIAHKVKGFRESIDRILADMVLCGFVKQPARHPKNRDVMRFDRNKTHSFVHAEDVIGRDQDRDHIINMLLLSNQRDRITFDDRSFSTVAIIGFGGLGKTTLAQFVYNNDKVKHGFEVCLWACINNLSNLELVLIEIIASKERRYGELGLERLQEKLREIIGGKKFLVVLDDVWDDNSVNWHGLETILRCGKSGSRVLVTTRSKKVAECLDTPKSCFVNLEVLSKESAWSLFMKKAFHKEEINKYPELEPLGKKIVSSCKNVPLAIIILGSLLRHRKREVNTWSHFLDDELGKALLNGDDDESIKNVLMVSYNDLPPHLKLCFAYCSLFPKDYHFEKDDLVRLWLAQGFVKPSVDNECLEELGEECFFHLVERCFFQEVKEYCYEDGLDRRNVNNCLYRHTTTMHDLLHDVALDVAKTESILLDETSIKKGKMDSLRHISIYLELDDFVDCLTLISNIKAIRTLLFRNYGEISINMSMLTSFRTLRTLNLQNRGIEKISGSIGNLIHLRYLNLSWNELLKNLPQSICKLHHLMFFDLRGCQLLEKLPPNIEKLVSLRGLSIFYCDKLDCLPSGLTGLTSLVNLDRLIVHRQSGGLGNLNGLDNLRGVLRIELPEERWPSAIEDGKGANMSKKHKLDGMVIDWKEKVSDTAQKMGKDETKAVLETLEPPQRIEYLKINNYGGEKFPDWFCLLKNVKELFLCGCEHVEYIEDELRANLCLPSLETLEFENMKNLRGWWRQDIPGETHRPCLAKVSRVTIHDCPELRGQMPLFDGIEYLNLRSVDVNLVMELLPRVNPNCSSLTPFDINHANRKLQELRLERINGLVCLPEGWVIRHLTAVQMLNICDCLDLRLLSRRGLSYLTTLKNLSLEKCENCEIGDEDGDENMEKEAVGMPWKALSGLKKLKILLGDKHLHEGLQYLTSLIELEIKEWKGLQSGDEEMGGVQLPSNTLQNLHTLRIWFDDSKTTIFHLPKAGIQYLHSLKRLKIGGCKELYLGWKTLLINMKLDRLELMHVRSVVDVEEMVVEQKSQLRSLLIYSILEVKWLHDIPWKSLAKSLDTLCFIRIGEMEELPDGIQHLTSLRLLQIFRCSKMRSVPKWIPHLTSLKWLEIRGCSEEVERRCERERGEDWPFIRHIPKIRIS